MPYEEIKITRRDMARAEIDSSIDLLMAEDFISAHVLSFAANAILRGVAQLQKIELFDEVLERYVKPEFLKQWRDSVNANYNTFKHADRDPEKELERFRPETTAFAIFAAVVNYGLIYGQWTFPMSLYRGWFLCRHPGISLPPLSDEIEKWKGHFDHPEGKPLSAALGQMCEMASLFKNNRKAVFDRLPAAALDNIEQ